jgi:adenylate cyclase
LTSLRVLVALVLLLLVGLPLAAWLDVRDLAAQSTLRQAGDFETVITGIRGFYANNIVQHVLDAPPGTPVSVTADYLRHPGSIPIPATFSLALGKVVTSKQGTVRYRFISHDPFKGRPAHRFDAFEEAALAALQRHPVAEISQVAWRGFSTQARYVTPIVMGADCVACHNASPQSPKRDWKVGQIGGIQELIVTQPVAHSLLSFRFLLIYLVVAGLAGLAFILYQYRQTTFLASISDRLSRYLSPQIYRSIFSGQTGSEINTKRKKLTVFFSDIKDFTSTAERMQPEQLTALLNEYFTEMSNIALAYGGTIDKFIGDAMLVFFGDPQTLGETQDAQAALRMADAMQRRAAKLAVRWHQEGIEQPFAVRMGINTGYCNVGNFGSADRMDYTIIGAEANLAARLQAIAQPGTIVVSYETYALVRDIVRARPLEPIHVKGVSREVRPYLVEGLRDETGASPLVFAAHTSGLDLYLDVGMLDGKTAAQARTLLAQALEALHARGYD